MVLRERHSSRSIAYSQNVCSLDLERGHCYVSPHSDAHSYHTHCPLRSERRSSHSNQTQSKDPESLEVGCSGYVVWRRAMVVGTLDVGWC